MRLDRATRECCQNVECPCGWKCDGRFDVSLFPNVPFATLLPHFLTCQTFLSHLGRRDLCTAFSLCLNRLSQSQSGRRDQTWRVSVAGTLFSLVQFICVVFNSLPLPLPPPFLFRPLSPRVHHASIHNNYTPYFRPLSPRV